MDEAVTSARRPFPIVVSRLALRRRHDPEPPTEAWVRERVALLRRIGWPALRRAGTPLAWVLAVDPERRDLVAELTADLTLPDGSVHLASGAGFVPGTDDLSVDEPVAPGRDRFVTVRMDTDDALLPGAVLAVVDLAARAADGTLVDLPRGYQLDVASGRTVEACYPPWRQGPFLALVHHGRERMLDTGGIHTEARAGRPVVRFDRPSWVQSVHGTNVSNALDARPLPRRALRAGRQLVSRRRPTAWWDGRTLRPGPASRLVRRAGIRLED